MANREGRLIGYARVSTEDQDMGLQIDALRRAGIPDDQIYREKVSGVSSRRYQLYLALKILRPGDTLVVWKLDRLGRSMLDLLTQVKNLTDRGIAFRSLTDGIDGNTPGGRFLLGVLAAGAQFERELIGERTKAGMARRKAQGMPITRPRILDAKKIAKGKAMLKSGASVKEVAAALKVSVGSIYNYFPERRTGRRGK